MSGNFLVLVLFIAVSGHIGSAQLQTRAQATIHLDVTLGIVDIDLTKEMNMICHLDNSSTMVSHLVSIVISRTDAKGKDILVASVSSFDTAKALVDLNSTAVNGTVQNQMVSRNYLKLTWDHPGQAQASQYKCDINAIDRSARPVLFTTNYTVVSRQPTIESIVDHVRILEANDLMQSQEIDQLKMLTTQLQTRLDVLEAKGAVVG